MNLPQIRAFRAVAMHRGFSTAAQALGVSQSAVTQQIKALEQALGARLFHRMGGTVDLTQAGRDLLPSVHRAAMVLDELGSTVSAARDLRVGHLLAGICAPHVAMPILKGFMTEYPGVRLEVRLENSGHLLDRVASHHFDVAIATLSQPHPDFFCQRLVAQRVLVMVPVDHPWAGRSAIDVGDLAGAPFVLREAGSMTRQLFQAGLEAAGVAIDERLTLGSREAVKEAVAAGVGCGIVLDRELGCDPRLAGIPVEGTGMAAAEFVVALPDIAELGAVAGFIAAARAVYRPEETPRSVAVAR
ncbi:MAG: LysR substrate-binding domain-containing protein [Ancalomicrobiaceae bacterium]|nr:LysR substrate-binding domain-containing protein [Ancalomicrobiaceae bacterium]